MDDLKLFLNRDKSDYDYLTYDNTNFHYANEVASALMKHLELRKISDTGYSWAFKKLSNEEIILLKLVCPVLLIIKEIDND